MKNHMRFDVLTLFPQMFEAVLGDSIIGRARENNILEMNFIDIRDFSTNKHRKVDDYPYSGGGGMLMNAQPVYDAYMSVAEGLDYKPFTIYMSPQGKVFNQGIAIDLANYEHIVLLCGHYEGIDQRVIDEIVDMELSVGDFVMTGGEIPAMTVIDTVSRLVPGVLAAETSYENESHFNGLLEYPQYTRPEIWHDRAVPAVLLTGAHDAVAKWQEETALEVTRRKRPDMLYDHRVNGEPYARYIRVFVPHKEREYDIVAFMKMIFHRRILTNREQKILKRMMPVLDSLPTPPECEKNSRIWLNSKNAGRILDMYAPLFDMLREHGIDYRIEYSDTPDGKPVAENENFTVLA